LDKFSARQYWGDAVSKYNQIPFISEKVNPKLDDYVTNEALKGLFSMVAEKEKDIRENPIARTTELLKKVFAKQDKK
jgi:phage I-like protein